MSKFEHKPRTFSLFKSDKKNDKSPDMTGIINIEGKLYQIAAWTKEGSKGKFLSGKYSEMRSEKHNEDLPF